MTTKRTAGKAKKRAATKRPARSARNVEPKEIASPAYDKIAVRAYEIWIANGCPDGQELEHWREAEAQLTVGR